ncbi:MAG: hypothetical protein Q9195_003666 [Heterodermia aff. obscurata]
MWNDDDGLDHDELMKFLVFDDERTVEKVEWATELRFEEDNLENQCGQIEMRYMASIFVSNQSSRKGSPSEQQTVQETELFRFNNYDIFNCGDPKNATSYASKLIGFLAVMKPQLERLIADAQLGTHSSRYAAFFKSNRNTQKVIAQLRNLIDGNPVIIAESRIKNAGSWTPQPKLICISDTNSHTVAWVPVCKKRPPQQPAFSWLGTEGVAICPGFWTLPQFPTDCPVMKGGRPASGLDHVLLKGMYAFMVSQLVRLYDKDIQESEKKYGTVGTMLEAMELDMRQSMLSATNYGFYAGGESGDLFLLRSLMGCTKLI